MKTVILCGGYGTRIRDVAEDIPKPMIPVGPYPILWHIMKGYAAAGFNDFVLCLGHKAGAIKEFFVNYEIQTRDFTVSLGQSRKIAYHSDHEESDWKVTCAFTGYAAMTGARVRRISKYLDRGEDFMLTYGDGLGDVDLKALVQFHKKHGRLMTVTGVRPPGRFGEMVCGADGRVTEFTEKPQDGGGMISGGFFVCKPGIFDYLPDREDLIFERDPMEQLVRDQQLMVFKHTGFWHPMDTNRDYQHLNDLYRKGNAPWVSW